MNEHKSDAELSKELEEAKTKVEVGATYTHYKTPSSRYIVEKIGVLEDGDRICVIYKSQNIAYKPTFVRPLTEWLEQVEWQGQLIPRFKKV